MFQGLKSKLEGFFKKPRSAKEAVASLSDEDRARFDSLSPLERASVLTEGSSFSKAAQIAALFEMGHTAEAKQLQASIGPIPVPVVTAPVAQSTPIVAASPTPKPSTALPALAAVPASPAPLSGQAKAAAAINAHVASAEARKAQQAAAAADTEAKRRAAQDELCKMVITFDGLHSQEARSAFWLLNRTKIEQLSKVETIKGSGWVGVFLRRR